MALSEENRILLQLILGRGKNYSDLSGLLGIDQGEVRSRARAALSELDPSQPAPDGDLTDYLLGQTDAIATADVKHRINIDPATAETAGALSDQLRLLVPGSSTPIASGSAPTTGAGAREGRSRSASRRPTGLFGGKSSTDSGGKGGSAGGISGAQRRLIAILLGAGLLAVILVLVLTGGIGGSDSDEKPENPARTTATLTSVKDETGKGLVEFGVRDSNPLAKLQISKLKPSGKNDSYALWLYGSKGVFPIDQAAVDNTRVISSEVPLNEAMICLIAADAFPEMRLSRVTNAEMKKTLRQARRANSGDGDIPDYAGKTVLKGRISMPQSAKDFFRPRCAAALGDETQ